MKCRGIAGVTEQGKHLPALHVIAIGHEHRILRRARRPGGDQVKAMQQGGGRMAVLVHREVQQKEPASAGLYRRCRFVSASRGAQPSGQSIAIEAGENLRRGVPAHDFDLLDCRRSVSCIRNHKLVDEVQLMVRPLNGKRGGPQRHATTGVKASSDRAGSAIITGEQEEQRQKRSRLARISHASVIQIFAGRTE